MFHRALGSTLLALVALFALAQPLHAQRTVKITKAWITLPSGETGPAHAFAVVENGTMYDVYLVRAESAAAAKAQLQHTTGGKTAATDEVAIPAFGQIEMSLSSVFLQLTNLKQKLKAGDTVPLTLYLDDGTALSAEAVVK
jgi:copper(I)-binding protein